MPTPDLNSIPPFYHAYVKLVNEPSVQEALAENTKKAMAALQSIPGDKWPYRYAEGKWTIKEMVQHIIDAERIFAYRALCIARGEKQSLPGFDENHYVAASGADNRNEKELLSEFETVRQGSEMLFQSFSVEQLNQTGIANGKPIGVNGIGYIMAGHVAHHLLVLQERYLT